MRMPSLVKIDKRFVNFPVFLGQGNFMAGNVVGCLEVANRTFEFFKMIGDIFGSHKFVPEYRTQQLAP